MASIIYRLTSLWKPDQSLLALVPDAPICYVSVKDLGGLIKTFQDSKVGNQTSQMPILAEIQKKFWWRQIVYQKRTWEYEMGGKLELKLIRGYLGEEAILSFYKRNDKISFLLISAVGAKEKLEIATLTAAASVNPNYKRLKENYRQLDINTITGYPRDFSYAFVGKIGLLTTDKSLIQDTIDIYEKQKQGFIDLQPIDNYLYKQYSADRNSVYIDFSRLLQVLVMGEMLKPLLDGVDTWTFSNRYENSIIRSRHRIVKNTTSQPKQSPRLIDKNVLSILPTMTAFLSVSNDEDLATLWKRINTNLPLQYQRSQIDLSRHVGSGIALALLASPPDAPVLIPPMLLICPIKNRAGLEADLTQLKQIKISLNGNPLQFHASQDYQGIELQPVQLRFGFLLSLKGGYALVDNYWIISTTLGGLKSAVDAFANWETALTGMPLPFQLESPGHTHILIQPSRFIPELKRFIPLIAAASGQKIDPELTRHIVNNLFPLEALGTITANIQVEGNFVDAEIHIVLEE